MSRSLIPNSTQIPDVILDEWMAALEGAELKVVLYVARRTYGFGKKSDRISIPQMAHGITTGDGEVLDRGTGLSERAIQDACNYLEACGVMLRKRASQPNAPSAFALNLAWGGALLDRAKWRKGVKTAALTPQPLHPAKSAPCNEQHSYPATVAPTRNSEQETVPNPNGLGAAAKKASVPKPSVKPKNDFDTGLPIVIFSDGFEQMYHDKPDLQSKHRHGLIQRFKACGSEEKFRAVVKAYLVSTDNWAVTAGHDVATFLSGTNDRWLKGGKAPPRAAPVGIPVPVTDAYAHLRNKPAARPEAV